MGEQQLLLALITPVATLAIVMVGFLYNNSRMSDLNSRMSDFRSEMKEMLRLHEAKHDANLRRVEEMLLGKFAELDTRLSRIEAHLNLK
jgi:hypothetical protein